MRYDELAIERRNNHEKSVFYYYKSETMMTNRYLFLKTNAFIKSLPHQPILKNVRKMVFYFENAEDAI